MTPKDIRTAIGNQCGFKKTQPQRLLESIIPNKADSDLVKPESVADNATTETGKAPAGCNYGNPNAVEIIECGCCGAYHRAAFYGDCRDDSERFADPEDFEVRWYGGGYPSIEVFPEETTPNKAIQVCNAGDWPTVKDQQRFWKERDEHLDRIESNALWFDNKAKNEIPF